MLTAVLLFFGHSAAYSQANSLPNLTPDPAIEKGQLPNGLTYYFATNKYAVNEASYALVQKKDAAIQERQLQSTARQSFDCIRYGKVTLADFLGRHGILPSGNGYIRCAKGSVVYTFENVSSARGEYIVDTVLLSIFNLAQAASVQGQPSSSQAIVIAGDFDRQEMLSRMKLLCLINPYVSGQVQYPEYKWEKSETTSSIKERGGAISRVSVKWRSPRVPEKFMETVFPVVSDKLSGEFEMILHNRLDASFAGKESTMTFDQHLLVSCIAPRAVFVFGYDNPHFNSPGEFECLKKAAPAWSLWGREPFPDVVYPDTSSDSAIGRNMAYFHRTRESGHGVKADEWTRMLEFADRNFTGE